MTDIAVTSNPIINGTCGYVFQARFVALNGIYRLIKTTSYNESIKEGTDFFKELYQPAGLTETDFENDWQDYQFDQIFTLEDVNDVTKVYKVPSVLIIEQPNPNIVKTYELSLNIRLGQFVNPNKVSWLVNYIDQAVAVATGTLDVTQLFNDTDNEVYMTKEEYELLDQDRNTRVQILKPHLQVIQEQLKIIESLQTQVATLEQAIIEIAS
jgi:hypothetical protein